MKKNKQERRTKNEKTRTKRCKKEETRARMKKQ